MNTPRPVVLRHEVAHRVGIVEADAVAFAGPASHHSRQHGVRLLNPRLHLRRAVQRVPRRLAVVSAPRGVDVCDAADQQRGFGQEGVDCGGQVADARNSASGVRAYRGVGSVGGVLVEEQVIGAHLQRQARTRARRSEGLSERGTGHITRYTAHCKHPTT